MVERLNRNVSKRITTAGIMAGVAGWSPVAQIPPTLPPIPELPFKQIETGNSPLTFPQAPLTTPSSPFHQLEELPAPSEVIKPVQPNFSLQPAPSGNNLTFEAISRETLPEPVPAFPAIPASPPLIFHTTTPREETEMRLDQALFSAAIGAALASTPTFAQDEKSKIPLATETGKKSDAPKEIEESKPQDVKKELEEVKKLLEALTAKQKQLGDTVLGKNEGKDQDAGIVKKIDDLGISIKTLDETVKKLDDKMTKLGDNFEKIRTANSSPLNNKDTTKTTGIVKLVNTYGERVTMILNGVPHRLEPGETKDVNVPIGVFDYALPMAGGEVKTSQVRDQEIVTLKIK